MPTRVADMGLLDRLRSWFGSGDTAETSDRADGTSEPAESNGLDPENVTEVRTEGSDDAAEKLRELSKRRSDEEDN